MKKMICLLITIVAAIYSTLTVYADYDEWLDVYHDETRYHYMIDVKSIKPLVMKDGSKAIHFNTLINVGDFIDIFYTVTNFTEINVYPDDGMIQARKIRSYPTAHDHVGAVWVMPDFHYLSDYDEHPIIPGWRRRVFLLRVEKKRMCGMSFILMSGKNGLFIKTVFA